jgi:hypothetical protein
MSLNTRLSVADDVATTVRPLRSPPPRSLGDGSGTTAAAAIAANVAKISILLRATLMSGRVD